MSCIQQPLIFSNKYLNPSRLSQLQVSIELESHTSSIASFSIEIMDLELDPPSILIPRGCGAGEHLSKELLMMDKKSTFSSLTQKELGPWMRIRIMIPRFLHWQFYVRLSSFTIQLAQSMKMPFKTLV